MAKSNKKLVKIIFDILRELYANSTPQGDFDELVANATIMDDGRKKIPFDDYEIEENLMVSIVNKHINENHLTKREKDIVKFEVYLGPSPKSKNE